VPPPEELASGAGAAEEPSSGELPTPVSDETAPSIGAVVAPFEPLDPHPHKSAMHEHHAARTARFGMLTEAYPRSRARTKEVTTTTAPFIELS